MNLHRSSISPSSALFGLASRASLAPFAALASIALVAGCSDASLDASTDSVAGGGAITSVDGAPLEFRFRAEVVASKDTPVKNAVVSQLEYLQGILTTGSHGNAQFRFVDVQDSSSAAEGDKTRWSYSATVAAIFPAGSTLPTTYDLALPLDVTSLGAFNDKYDGKCGTNEYGRDVFWHDFNPKASGCTLTESDVHRTKATVRKHPLATTDKYPEYDQVWADGSLDVVAVYGAIASSADTDTGATDRESFLKKAERALTNAVRKDEEPRNGILKESSVTGEVSTGGGGVARQVKLTAFFVEEVKSGSDEFFARYSAASAGADVVVYSGHSGLGKNIAALTNATRATKGKYQVVFLNGCQTFGYLGPKMHEERIALNGADVDPHGTKFLDVIVTTLPAYAESVPTEQILFDAMIEEKKSYTALLGLFSGQQWNKHLTSVFGEDDNTFTP